MAILSSCYVTKNYGIFSHILPCMYVCMYSFFNVNYRTKLTAFFSLVYKSKLKIKKKCRDSYAGRIKIIKKLYNHKFTNI